MTIAACYVSSEGVVLGADSTTTMQREGWPDHHYNFGQKIFEIGEKSTLASVFWGLGAIGSTSYRTMFAELSDSLVSHPPGSVRDVAETWRMQFLLEYQAHLGGAIARFQDLVKSVPRSQEEEDELRRLAQLSGGFCIAGRVLTNRTPQAFEVAFAPWIPGLAEIRNVPLHLPKFWGCENLLNRLLLGMDNQVFGGILSSGKWTGTQDDLLAIIQPHFLRVPMNLPLREAVDWIYASIYTTIKAMKFSHWPPFVADL